MKRVLFVSYHFPPSVAGGIPRIADFTRMLPDHGWMPTVLTSPPQGRAGIDNALLESIPREVRIVRAHCPFAQMGLRGASQQGVGVKARVRAAGRAATHWMLFPDRSIVWGYNAIRAADALIREEPFDAVLSTLGPASDIFVGHVLASRWKRPHVVDFRDLWADVPWWDFPTPAHRAAAIQLERWVTRRAAQVITVAEGMTQHLRDRHSLDASRMSTVTNGFDESQLSRAVDRRNGSGPLRLMFTGSVYGPHDFGQFFEALAQLRASGEISPATLRVQFIGNLSPEVPKSYGVEEFVEVESYVPRGQVFDRLGAADVLLLIEGKDYWANFSYPAKVFDYLLTGKVILALVEPKGNCARLLDEVGGHILGERDSAVDIARAIRDVLRRGHVPARAVDTTRPPLDRFRRRVLVERLAGVLDRAAAAG
jgi:hypothetical protein